MKINQYPEKTSLDTNDLIPIWDSAGNVVKVVKKSVITPENTLSLNGSSPPTIADTLLLLRGESILDSSTFARTLTNTNVSVSNVQKVFDSNSLLFNGNNAVITTASTNLNILSGDFTIETNAYFLTLSGFRSIIAQWQQTSGLGGFMLSVSGNTLEFRIGSFSETNPLLSFSALAVNTWYHIAVTRKGNDFFLYVNGLLRASSNSATTRNASSVNISIGHYYNSSGSIPATGASYLHAHLDELRICNKCAYSPISLQPTARHPG